MNPKRVKLYLFTGTVYDKRISRFIFFKEIRSINNQHYSLNDPKLSKKKMAGDVFVVDCHKNNCYYNDHHYIRRDETDRLYDPQKS